MLKDMGVSWVLTGHSERRSKGETNSEVAMKAGYALSRGLGVIACVGETRAERDGGKTMEACKTQLAAYADHIKDWSKVGETKNYDGGSNWFCPVDYVGLFPHL